jgi:hypothetical protein
MAARSSLCIALLWIACGCVRPQPARLPSNGQAYVAVFSGEMAGAFRDLARHSWIVSSSSRGYPRRLQRYEWAGDASVTPLHEEDDAFSPDVPVRDVAVHGIETGSPEEIDEAVACLERETAKYKDFNCGCWPGPSSNTFTDLLIRRCGLGIELPATALGKDYRGPIGVSTTEARTGVQLQTWAGGVKIGLREGVQANFTGLTLGVHFWPPGVEVPVNPGRLGVDTSTIRRDERQLPPFTWLPNRPVGHRYGVGSIAMVATYNHVADPSRAAGLSDRSVVGLTARGLYGKRVGLGVGFDVEAGVTAPLGFAYRTTLYPIGIGLVLGETGFVGVYSGVGTSGASSTVTARLELPQELRLELDLQRHARLVLRGGVLVIPDHGAQRDALETFFGTSARLGTSASGHDSIGGATGGFFVGVERRQILHTYWLGATFGYELGAGG